MMRIILGKKEVTEILRNKYGIGVFEVIYTESDKAWEARTGKKMQDQQECPEKVSHYLYFD